MNEVKVLIEGYAKQIENGWIASSTVTLIQADGKNIIVDPGCNRQKLLQELEKSNLKTTDIDFVVLTHSHTDHSLLCGIFENAKVLNSYEIYTNDEQIEHQGKIQNTPLQIIETPGHSEDGISLIVKADDGTYAIVGDVFWWMDNEKQKVDIERPDQAHKGDINGLIESRKKILEIADFIIPGHGKIFNAPK